MIQSAYYISLLQSLFSSVWFYVRMLLQAPGYRLQEVHKQCIYCKGKQTELTYVIIVDTWWGSAGMLNCE